MGRAISNIETEDHDLGNGQQVVKAAQPAVTRCLTRLEEALKPECALLPVRHNVDVAFVDGYLQRVNGGHRSEMTEPRAETSEMNIESS